jgi:hypothetical protein
MGGMLRCFGLEKGLKSRSAYFVGLATFARVLVRKRWGLHGTEYVSNG